MLAVVALCWRMYARKCGFEWNQYVYVPPAGNLDLYLGGMIFGYLNAEQQHVPGKIEKIIAAFLLTALLIVNSYFFNLAYFGDSLGEAMSKYFFQTAYLIVCLYFIRAFDTNCGAREKVSCGAIRRNPARLVDAFASISFEFYLFHSLVLDRISGYVLMGHTISWGLHVRLLLLTAIITLVLSIGFHRIFSIRTA